jgi:predicted outer membrane repeat protein
LALATAIQAKTVYVAADGKGDFPSIRTAVQAAKTGDIIVLEPGVYFGMDNQDITFAGKVLTLRSRDPNNPTTVADTVIDCQGDPVRQVATHYAIGARPEGQTRLTLAGLTIHNGYDVFAGGAVRCEEVDLDAINCTFADNTIDSWGGAVYCRDNHARFIGCTFTGNASKAMRGGAIYCSGSKVELVRCTFDGNTGCAVETFDCQLTLTDCVFQHNQGQDGGALRCQADLRPESTSLDLTRCTFLANSARSMGGALYNHGIPANIIACTFTGNTAGQDGGAIYNFRSSPAVADCAFVGNTATGAGGAVYNLSGSHATILNCTLVANDAAVGGAVASKGGSNPLLSHCILWNNTATQGASVYIGRYPWSNPPTATVQIEYSDVEGDRGSAYAEPGCDLTWTAGNISADPLFIAPDRANYRLSPGSPCIDAGDPKYTPKSNETDLDGRLRRLGLAVDMGAYEQPGLGPVYRFWSPVTGRHFYTIKKSERDKLVDKLSYFWQLEGVAYYAFYQAVEENLLPVHRFWSAKLGAHFWTISEDERQKTASKFGDTWTYEGIAFYAYPQGRQPLGTMPVYRFWSNQLGSHFYTLDEDEKNGLIRNYPKVWQFEGAAWCAYAKPDQPRKAAYIFMGGPQEASYALTLNAYVDGKSAQITTPDVKLSPSSTRMQMTIDFGKRSTTLDGLRVQTTAIEHNAMITHSGSGVTIPLALSIQASFEASTPQGPFAIDPTTGVFADFAKANENLVVQDPVFRYSGSARFGDQAKSFDLQAAATRLELAASGTFEAINLLPEEIQARMPFTFQWHRQHVKDLLAETSVNGHLVQLYITDSYLGTQGLWKGNIVGY